MRPSTPTQAPAGSTKREVVVGRAMILGAYLTISALVRLA